MNTHRFVLEKYKGTKTRFQCPSCQARGKTFTRYIDLETGKYISPMVGRCDRESNCGYHYTPKQYYQDNNIPLDRLETNFKGIHTSTRNEEKKQISFIDSSIFKASLREYERNNFVKFLINRFGEQITNELIAKYYIGTSNHWKGTTIFWQVDINGNIRTGKMMLYNADTGKRVKDPFNHISWAHKFVKDPEHFALAQCLFGEHLIKDNPTPIAIVESEKTAIISSIYFPQFIWLAAGQSNGLNFEKCRILKNRIVTLFPDIKQYGNWSKKAKELSPLAEFKVSDLLERKCSESEKHQGLDLADYLLRLDYRNFAIPEAKSEAKPILKAPIIEVNREKSSEFIGTYYSFNHFKENKSDWTEEISEIEQFFSLNNIESGSIQIDKNTTIIDLKRFIISHLSIVKAQNGNSRYLPYLDRLKYVKQALIQKKN